jgi:hypothetical protein
MIQVIKLVSGEELVGDVTTDAEGVQVVIKQPCYLQMIPARSESSQSMMALVPYAMYLEDHSVTIESKNILWSGKPVTELYNQYNSVFGSGIQLAAL